MTLLGQPQEVTLVLHGSVGGYQDYEVIRAQDEPFTFSDRTNEYAKIIQTNETEVVRILGEHEVDYGRVHDTVVLNEDQDDLRHFLAADLNPRDQNRYIARRTGHPSAQVEGYRVDPENREIEVDYTHIPGL